MKQKKVRLEREHANQKFKNCRSASIEGSFWKVPELKGIWKRNSQLSWLGILDGGGK